MSVRSYIAGLFSNILVVIQLGLQLLQAVPQGSHEGVVSIFLFLKFCHILFELHDLPNELTDKFVPARKQTAET